jgi:uncharacterized protein
VNVPDPASAEIVVTARKPVAVAGPVAFPDWRVRLDGEDLTDKLRPYLMRVRVSERRADLADQLDIELDDSAGLLDIPKSGAELSVKLGWKGGGGTTPGLVDKGKFIVDEASHDGPPRRIIIRARSADFTSEWRKVRDGSWKDKTLSVILTDVAARQGITLKIADELGGIELKLVTQSRENDLALVQRLGKEHDAVSTVKHDTLIFTRMAGGKSASGQLLETVTINYREGDGHSYRIEAREDWTGVVAKWHDKKAAKQKTVHVKGRKSKKTAVPTRDTRAVVGTVENPKVLKKLFASEAEAKRAAEAEWKRIQRAPRKLSCTLALGRPEISAEQPAVVKGFHPEIDEQDWIVVEATHSLDNKGLTSALSFEVPDSPADGGSESDDASVGETA